MHTVQKSFWHPELKGRKFVADSEILWFSGPSAPHPEAKFQFSVSEPEELELGFEELDFGLGPGAEDIPDFDAEYLLDPEEENTAEGILDFDPEGNDGDLEGAHIDERTRGGTK